MKVFALGAALLFSGFASAQATTWTVDSSHASIVFKVNHLGFSNVYGLIPGLEGTIVFDEAKPEKSTFDLKLPVDKIHSGAAKRDEHLMKPDFFNAKQFPTILIKSKSVKKNGNKLDVVADVTMLGVTKPVSFTFNRMKTGKDPWGKDRTGGETAFKIKRTDFGMSYMSKPGEVSDEVELMISLEATK